MAVGDNMPVMGASTYATKEFSMAGVGVGGAGFDFSEPLKLDHRFSRAESVATEVMEIFERNKMAIIRRVVKVIIVDRCAARWPDIQVTDGTRPGYWYGGA